MAFARGRAKTGGRQKGVTNKKTAELKEAILQAFDKAGGATYLKKIADDHPQVFCSLLGRVLPLTVGGDPEQPHKLVIEWLEPGASE